MICNVSSVIPDSNLHFSDYIEKCQQLIIKRRLDKNQYLAKFDQIVDLNSPFELKPNTSRQEGKTYTHGALLIHGLLDCPFSMLEIAQQLQLNNILCRSVLLPGHGTRPEDLINVHYSSWIETVRYGIKSLQSQVDKLYLIGYSTGATLALWHAINELNPSGIIMLAPAISLKKPLDGLLNIKKLTSLLLKYKPWLAQTTENDYTRYKSIPINAVIQLNDLINQVDIAKHQIDCPLLLIMSQEDETVCKFGPTKFFEQQKHPDSRAIVYAAKKKHYRDKRILTRPSTYPDLHITHFSHNAIPFSPNNLHYGKTGDYPQASSHTPLNIEYGAYNRIEVNLFTLLNTLRLSSYKRQELTYNPDFKFMVDEIASFITR